MAEATGEEVLAYLREEHAASFELTVWTRAAVHSADPDLSERVYRGWRGIGFHHPEAGYVVAIYPRGEHVELLFEHGAVLQDPDAVLQGEGTQTRSLRIDEASPALARRIKAYVQQAIAERLLR